MTAPEKSDLQRVFQTAQALADCGLTEPEDIGGASNMSLLGEYGEIFDVAQLHGHNRISAGPESQTIAFRRSGGQFSYGAHLRGGEIQDEAVQRLTCRAHRLSPDRGSAGLPDAPNHVDSAARRGRRC